MLNVWMYQAVAHLQPLGDVLDDARCSGEQLGRQEQRRRDQEDDRRVVRLVARRADDEELRDGGRGREDERTPSQSVVLGSRPMNGSVTAAAPTSTSSM